MTIELFDTHTHLDATDFDQDRDEVITRARAAGVTRILTIGAGYGIDSAARAIAIAEKHDNIWASAGVHPHDASHPLDVDALRTLAGHPKVRAIGETGLDFFKEFSPRAEQERWFEAQVALAIEVGKPIIIHSREAGKECIDRLENWGASKVGGVFHCYAEDSEFAVKLRKINFLVSFPGSLTFKKATALRETASKIPLEQIMLETDAPYLAPEPFRGKRCESAFTLETAKMLAQIKNLTLEEVAAQTTKTAREFYKV